MNDDSYKLDANDELAGELRVAVERLKQRRIPEAAMQRALDRAARCGASIRWTHHRLWRQAALGFAAVAFVSIALGLWFLHPSNAWADVIKAVQAKPWIHGTLRGVKAGQSRELWLSTSRAVGGFRSQEQILFFDDRLQVTYRYEPQEKVLYRLPASGSDLGQGQEFLVIFQGLFRGDTELKAKLSGLILKNQKRAQISREGRKWEEYELFFQDPSHPDADLRMKFFVDAQTRLPYSMTMMAVRGDSLEWAFDYPKDGPADIYALGAPKDAKLVDRVPTGDMSRMLAAIQAGRDRFDDFHAISVRGATPDSFSAPGKVIPMVFLVWKKANRWRVEVAGAPRELVRNGFPPNVDLKQWVREACKRTRFDTINVCDGKVAYECSLGARRGEFKSVAVADNADSWCPEAMGAMPVTWCYPRTFNPPNHLTEEIVNPKPSEGPPNTILVTSRWAHPRPNGFPLVLFWLDPTRGYAVVRNDFRNADPAQPPTDRDMQQLMDQWEQTPSGVWYAKRVGTGGLKELKTGGTWYWYHFFLDFNADMPAELFKPAKRTVLTDLYPVGR